MTSVDNHEELPPLDPAMERVRRKMIRLLVVSISIMMIGLMAVLFAVVYKVGGGAREVAGNATFSGNELTAQDRIEIPDNGDVVSASLNASRILLHVRSPARQELIVYDLESGKIIARVALE